jgi:SAM-dependent methyltransferase
MKKPNKNQWSQGYHMKALIEQRKFMCHPDTIKMFARWLGFRQGQNVVDVGCGLGYLGMIYWPYFGRDGRYHGIDISPELIKQAAKQSKQWAVRGKAVFKPGDAYRLPLPDNFADAVMCQTVLMHLKDPGKALVEMARVVKPGGIVFCQEPDNLSTGMMHGYDTLPERTVSRVLFLHKVQLLVAKGRAKLGLGDANIGPKLPMMMRAAGLRQIEARNTDKVFMFQPPYDTPIQQYLYQQNLETVNTSDWDKCHRITMKEYKRFLLVAGGTPKDYDRFRRICAKDGMDYRAMKQQLNDGTFAEFSPLLFFVIKGRKPVTPKSTTKH